MLTPASQLMPSLLQVVNPQNMTESEIVGGFNEAPCRNRCGELLRCEWDNLQKQWYFDQPCPVCSEKESQAHQYRNALEASGITPEETKLTLASFVPTAVNKPAFDAAKRLSMGDDINLFLHGKAGRGKTHLAIGVLLERLVTGRVRFFPITKALMNIRGNLRETSEDQYIAKMLACDVLVMDDFGANKLTEWNLSFMDCFFDEWYRRRYKGLIVTSNFSLRQISENISDRIASRLAQLCEVYEMAGDDHRIG